jgi:hypothetical protein
VLSAGRSGGEGQRRTDLSLGAEMSGLLLLSSGAARLGVCGPRASHSLSSPHLTPCSRYIGCSTCPAATPPLSCDNAPTRGTHYVHSSRLSGRSGRGKLTHTLE